MKDYSFNPIGERGMQVWLPDTKDPAKALKQQQRIWALAQHCRRSGDFVEVVPGMNNLTLLLPEVDSDFDWQRALDTCGQAKSTNLVQGTRHRIPVCYDGPDLEFVAGFHGIKVQEVIRLHCQAQYQVLFLGFLPGFAYLGGLPPALATPRRQDPRLKVPAGSVGIGGRQTGIYPSTAPGGWQLLGRTSVPLLERDNCLLQPGDRVEFVSSETG